MFHKVITPIEVSIDMVQNLFECAVEGGSNYWCAKIRPLNEEDNKLPYDAYMLKGFKVTLDEPMDDSNKITYEVTTENIKEALEIMAKEYPHTWSCMLDDLTDAETGDVFLQLCAFKELIYG